MQSPRAKSPAPPPREASPPPAQVPFNARRSLSLLLFDQVPQAAAKKAKTPSKKDTQAASSEVSRAPALCTRVNSHRPSAAISLIPELSETRCPQNCCPRHQLCFGGPLLDRLHPRLQLFVRPSFAFFIRRSCVGVCVNSFREPHAFSASSPTLTTMAEARALKRASALPPGTKSHHAPSYVVARAIIAHM